jgi:riboflavin kinase/FMN adenylyltransferase
MGIFSSIEQFGEKFTNPVNLALGMFDGVHLGHQQVLSASQNHACDINGVSVAFTFPFHPASFLRPDSAPPLLMNAQQKARMLHSYCMDHVILRDFDEELAQVSARDFGVFLKERIPSVEGLSVGRNFRFGKGREGDSSFLEEVGEKMGMHVQVVDSKNMGGGAVSSSRIREALVSGEIEIVNQMLGRNYRIYGSVFPGKKMGRSIGFPTMNLDWNPQAQPAYGVYAGQVKNLNSGSVLPAVANYGIRPTVEENAPSPKLEIHVLEEINEDEWGYDAEIEMSLDFFIRHEKKFSSVEELKSQISEDLNQAKGLHSNS